MNEVKTEDLENVIDMSDYGIEEQEKKLKEIDEQIEAINKKIEEAELEWFKNNPPQILTRSQMEMLDRERKKDLQKKREDDIVNVEENTKQAFAEALEILKDAESLPKEEKRRLELKARNIEINALKKEIEIREEICERISNEFEDALAQKIADEAQLISCRKKWIKETAKLENKSSFSDELKNKINLLQFNKNHSQEAYRKLSKKLHDAKLKLFKTQKRLNGYFN